MVLIKDTLPKIFSHGDDCLKYKNKKQFYEDVYQTINLL